MSQYTIASVSCGKDSLVIPHEYIKRGLRLDEVMMYDTGMEFQAIYDEWASLVKILDENGIKHTVLKPEYEFCWQMFERPVNQGKENEHLGYSWCGGTCRWGTADKRTILGKYAEERDAIVLVGIAADEAHRREKEFKPYKRFPLIDWGMSEADCLAYCYERGHEWREHGAATPDGTIRLYDILDRVSCWCCTNKNLDELRNVYHLLPEYWERLKDLQRRTCRPMKGEGKSVFDLETRFKLEDKRAAAGLSIRSREFFRELAGKLEAGGGNDGA